MKSIEKRLEKIESVTPAKSVMNGLGELYEWQETPEGKAELDKLYDENRYYESEQ